MSTSTGTVEEIQQELQSLKQRSRIAAGLHVAFAISVGIQWVVIFTTDIPELSLAFSSLSLALIIWWMQWEACKINSVWATAISMFLMVTSVSLMVAALMYRKDDFELTRGLLIGSASLNSLLLLLTFWYSLKLRDKRIVADRASVAYNLGVHGEMNEFMKLIK